MILIDTNILLYAVNSDAEKCSQAQAVLEDVVNQPSSFALSWSVVYEFLRVATHRRVFPSPLSSEDAWAFVSELITQPNCHVLSETSEHQQILSSCLSELPRIRGNNVHDLHIAVLMREHGVKDIFTEDQDFRMFPWVKSISLSS